jgi:hypothetical protein
MGQQPKTIKCSECDKQMPRDYLTDLAPVHYNSQGFHRTDYDKYGDKKEALNEAWSKAWGEPPPKPDSTVPRNSKEPI